MNFLWRASREVPEGQPQSITINTSRGDEIDRGKAETTRKRDNRFVLLMTLLVGVCLWLLAYDMYQHGLGFLAVMLVFAGLLGVAETKAYWMSRGKSSNSYVVPLPLPLLLTFHQWRDQVVDNAAGDPALIQYKQILRSILPPEFLSAEGFLKTATGASEPIAILPKGTKSWFSTVFAFVARDSSDPSVPPAIYYGPMCYRALLYRLMRAKAKMELHEFQLLRDLVEFKLREAGPRDIIDIRRSRYRGVLAHETFHDIQNFLYENQPDVIARIWESSEKLFPEIERWYYSPANAAYREPGSYRLEHFFPDIKTRTPYPHMTAEWVDTVNLSRQGKELFPSIGALVAISDAERDLGRNELVPTLLSAASEGNTEAADILADIFEEAGLNRGFYETLPRVES
jgi:hypothetical protein